jgi:NAD(P)H-dependent flavin oxidoreductase YrpB (nitropropane dioxygenase family)
MQTPLCKVLGIEVPIIQAPMGGAVGPAIAAAVSNAGGLGMLVLWRADLETVRGHIRETRSLTRRPFGVNLNLEFPQEERLAVCLDEGVPIISFFWRDPAALVPRAKAANAIVLHTVGTAEAARRAVACGVDVVVAQGWEAGGHVRATVATLPAARSGRCRRSIPHPRCCRGWDRRRPRPCRGPRARSIGRMDWNAVSRKP